MILNYYKNCYEIPVFNFFESENDISFMLKEHQKLNEKERLFLTEERAKIQEWFTKEVDSNAYNDFIVKMSAILKLKYKYVAIEKLHDSLKGFDLDVRCDEILNEENLKTLKELCQELGMPFRILLKDMQATLLKFKNAYQSKIEYKLREIEMQKSNEKGDYMDGVISLSKDIGFRLNPKEVTLYEFAKMINSLKKNGRGNKTKI